MEFITFKNDKGQKIYLIDKLPSIIEEKEKSISKIKDYNELWNIRFSRATNNLQTIVNQITEETQKEFECITKPWHKWFGFYIKEPTQRKTLFAVIIIGKNTASLCFRINPNTFNDDINNNIRKVDGFFFPSGTERRIHLDKNNSDKLISYLTHSYTATKKFL